LFTENMMSGALSSLSAEMLPAVEAEMRDLLGLRENRDDPFYGMMHYHMGWTDSNFNQLELTGGKRVRPLLCLLTNRAAGADWRQAIPAAASIEIVHNFTLVHDDIQDASPTRRGRQTLWKLWGSSQAINTGDAMFAVAHLAMVRLRERKVSDSTTIKAVRMLDETCFELTKGQYVDMNFEGRPDVTVAEYLSMINGKTAALLAMSAELGSVIAECQPEISEHYAAFGRDLGLAFQIRDDILGIWGDESLIGKSAATDIATRKKSLPVLFGLSRSEELRRLYGDEKTDGDFVSRVVERLDEIGAREFAEKYEKEYADSAVAHLEAVSPRGKAGEAILQLTGTLLNRQF
jgi:geranylgeranyl diphosphate synthase type I